jgi:peptidoglycan hydrolase-like protein with peptidoglycan-binding domain
MTRVLFSRGSRGNIIRSIQQQLQQRNLYTGLVDGDYGPSTEHAVQAFQTQQSLLPATGSVDDVTWGTVMNAPPPSIFERSLQLTSTFEGHGFGKVQGNWDKAWLTWGIIGFTLKHGEVGAIVREINQANPTLLTDAFGVQAAELLNIVSASSSDQLAWANSITSGTGVIEPWHSGFQKLGENSTVQAIQLAHASKDYFEPATATAAALSLQTELGLALCFDIHVQNGGVNADARQVIANAVTPGMDERSRRVIIANAVADAALPAFRDDVRSRKLTLANGTGTVHGAQFTVSSWGIGEFPA